jgi:hypothetical protein
VQWPTTIAIDALNVKVSALESAVITLNTKVSSLDGALTGGSTWRTGACRGW